MKTVSPAPETEVIDADPDVATILAVAEEQLKAASLKSKVCVYSSVCIVTPLCVGIQAGF